MDRQTDRETDTQTDGQTDGRGEDALLNLWLCFHCAFLWGLLQEAARVVEDYAGKVVEAEGDVGIGFRFEIVMVLKAW